MRLEKRWDDSKINIIHLSHTFKASLKEMQDKGAEIVFPGEGFL